MGAMLEFHQPAESWRNHQRVAFIKGFYQARHEILRLCDAYQQSGFIEHDVIDSALEDHMRELKEISHILFRVQTPEDKQMEQRLFDKVLGEVWHEMGKARDNIRLLEAYSGQVSGVNERIAKSVSWLEKQVIASARRDLPAQMKRSRKMMEKLVSLFEHLLPLYQDNEVIIRTLYFSRLGFDPLCKPDAVTYFFTILFGSVHRGYLELIRSLIRTKHISDAQAVLNDFHHQIDRHPEALETYRLAEHELKSAVTPSGSAIP